MAANECNDKLVFHDCPFCGGQPILSHKAEYTGAPPYRALCQKCGASSGRCNNSLDAATAWNRRVISANEVIHLLKSFPGHRSEALWADWIGQKNVLLNRLEPEPPKKPDWPIVGYEYTINADFPQLAEGVRVVEIKYNPNVSSWMVVTKSLLREHDETWTMGGFRMRVFNANQRS